MKKWGFEDTLDFKKKSNNNNFANVTPNFSFVKSYRPNYFQS